MLRNHGNPTPEKTTADGGGAEAAAAAPPPAAPAELRATTALAKINAIDPSQDLGKRREERHLILDRYGLTPTAFNRFLRKRNHTAPPRKPSGPVRREGHFFPI